ncbi:MAG TPA: hypothetical protein VL282_14390, partial [Tepidisphaeraceae bacterium]|nr:hypothetical protein [Tepidisphaeraceae bacterium]
ASVPIGVMPPPAVQTPTQVTPFDGSSLQQSLRYRGSIYETYKSNYNSSAERNYYYSYPSSYYDGYGGGYSFTPWWGGYPYGARLPAKMQHAR